MLTQTPTSAEWLGLYEVGMAAFIFGMLIIVFAILFLEWSELGESVKSITKFINHFFKPKKSNESKSL